MFTILLQYRAKQNQTNLCYRATYIVLLCINYYSFCLTKKKTTILSNVVISSLTYANKQTRDLFYILFFFVTIVSFYFIQVHTKTDTKTRYQKRDSIVVTNPKRRHSPNKGDIAQTKEKHSSNNGDIALKYREATNNKDTTFKNSSLREVYDQCTKHDQGNMNHLSQATLKQMKIMIQARNKEENLEIQLEHNHLDLVTEKRKQPYRSTTI